MKAGLVGTVFAGCCALLPAACGGSERGDSEERDDAGNGATPGGAGGAAGSNGGSASSGAGQGGTANPAGAGGSGSAGASASGGAAGWGTGAAAGNAAGGAPNAGGSSAGVGGGGSGGGGAAGAGNGGSAGSGASCEDLTLLFLVDTSRSMAEQDPRLGEEKLIITTSVLMEAIGTLPDSVRAGLVFFPQAATGQQPCFEEDVTVPIAGLSPDQREQMAQALAAAEADGGTPTFDAYLFASTQLMSATSGPAAIVFVTDGVPNYGPDCEGNGTPEPPVDYADVVALVQSTHDAGVHTLAVAAPAAEPAHEMLTQIARAGGDVGACTSAAAEGCFFDFDVQLDLGPWLDDAFSKIPGACSR